MGFLRSRLTAWASIASLAVFVFGPALNRVFASDHLWYLAQLRGDTSWAAGLRLADYSAVREYWPGDESIFRPLTYVWFAAQYAWFGVDHHAWNMAALVLHVLTMLIVYELLRAIRPSGALPAALLVAVGMPPMEMAIWNNVSGFLWSTLLVMLSLRAVVGLLRAETSAEKTGWTAMWVFSMSAANLFAEFALVWSALGCVTIWIGERRRPLTVRRLALLTLPLAVYAAAYAWHVTNILAHGRPVEDFVRLADPERLRDLIPNAVAVTRRWLLALGLPSAVSLSSEPYERLAQSVDWHRGWLANLALAAITAVTMVNAVAWRRIRRLDPSCVLLLAAPLGYVLLLCVARPPSEMLSNSYYLYPFWASAIVACYAVVDPGGLTPLIRAMLLTVVLAYAALNGSLASATSRHVERTNAAADRYLRALASFVDAHRRENGFSFSVRGRSPQFDPRVTLETITGRASAPFVSEILFAPFCREPDAAYEVAVEPSGLMSFTRRR